MEKIYDLDPFDKDVLNGEEFYHRYGKSGQGVFNVNKGVIEIKMDKLFELMDDFHKYNSIRGKQC